MGDALRKLHDPTPGRSTRILRCTPLKGPYFDSPCSFRRYGQCPLFAHSSLRSGSTNCEISRLQMFARASARTIYSLIGHQGRWLSCSRQRCQIGTFPSMIGPWTIGAQLSTSHSSLAALDEQRMFDTVRRVLEALDLDLLIIGFREAPEVFRRF